MLLRLQVVSASCRHIAEPGLQHTRLDAQVYDLLLIAVVYAGKLGLIGLLIHYLDFLYYLRRDILGCQRRVVQKEFLAAYHYLVYRLSLIRYRSVTVHIHAGQLLEQILQHVIVSGLVSRGTVLYRIFLNHYGIADSRHHHRVQHLHVLAHEQLSEVRHRLVHRDIADKLPVPDHIRHEHILARRDSFNHTLAVGIRHGIVCAGASVLGKIYGGERHRFQREGVGQLYLHSIVTFLRKKAPGGKYQQQRRKKAFVCHRVSELKTLF